MLSIEFWLIESATTLSTSASAGTNSCHSYYVQSPGLPFQGEIYVPNRNLRKGSLATSVNQQKDSAREFTHWGRIPQAVRFNLSE